MAVTDRRGCDGCGRTLPVEDLHSVTMPDGHTAVCCPECREYAETAAEKQAGLDQRRRACDGCGTEHRVADLTSVTLSDGTSVLCCDDCERHVPGRDDDGTADSRDRSSGAAGRTDSGGPTDSGTADRESGDGSTGADETAVTTNRCDDCRETFTVELYRVETVDGRTQSFCPECKEEGLEEGVVKAVRMRRSEAYATLEVDGEADQETIRDAYLEKVKEAHPDRTDGDRSEFKAVKRAYDRLAE
ncbi:J domain-containing protein [Halostella salina]|uniref:J domain-containing protein n=1 Tax=Halostella salina TaxID=1547897 RepID=UPI000EF781D5|nr:J domain-containing protein [Halostella salina]